jgi:hypothetical protein
MQEVNTDLVEIMALVKGNVDQELLLRNEFLAAENEILRSRIEGRLLLTRAERARSMVREMWDRTRFT